ncbi:hypothetical protein [Candidatus Palauibacter sp.]|uniref:hypothetical protein n=1 Tax=Candidatus Palauibacter sp. TaxID=3101350 RepID=UPI003B02E524
MSRAFVNEDATHEPEPRYVLPPRESPRFDAAAARALLEGAHVGNTRSAETATGYGWGEPALAPHIEDLIREAEGLGDERMARLGRRYLTAARR